MTLAANESANIVYIYFQHGPEFAVVWDDMEHSAARHFYADNYGSWAKAWCAAWSYARNQYS